MYFVEQLAKKYNREYWLEKAEKREFLKEMWQDIAKQGYFGILIPEEYGGAYMGLDAARVFVEALASHGLATLHFIAFFMNCALLTKWCNERQRSEWLPQLASGTFCSFAITEPNAGTNMFKISTLATKEGEYYRIRGQKIFVTGAKESKYMVLVCRTIPFDRVEDKRHGLSIFFIEPHIDGIKMHALDMLTIAPENQYIVYFDDALISAKCLIGEENKGFRYIFDLLNPERVLVAALCVGYGRYVLSKAVKYVSERTIFEEPIGSYQAVQHMLSRAYVELELAELATQRAAELYDSGADASLVGAYANMAKLAASEAAFKACDIAVQVHGGYGFVKEYDIMTVLPLVRVARIAPVNNEMILNYIGQHILRLPKSYK